MTSRGLRFKLMAAVGASLLVLFLVQFFTARSVLTQGYSKLEFDKTQIQVASAKSLIEQQDDQLSGVGTDWAHWDDTYEFIAKPNHKYIESNYTEDTFSHLNVNAIILADNQGKIIYQRGYDYLAKKTWQIPSVLTKAVGKNGFLSNLPESGHLSGLLWTPEGLMIVAATDILPSTSKDQRRGVMIMARRLDQTLLRQIEGIVNVKISIANAARDKAVPDDMRQAYRQLVAGQIDQVRPLSENEVAGYVLMPEIGSEINLILRTVSDRSIHAQGKTSMDFVLWSTGAIVILLGLFSWLFDKMVLSRLTRLNSSVLLIDKNADTSARVPVLGGNDELSNLAQRINGMLGSIEESEFRWKFAIEGAGDGVWDWDIQTNAVHYSKRWKEMLGYEDGDILPSNDEWVTRIHPDDQSYVAETMRAYLEGKSAIYVVEYRLRCKDSSYKWILGRGMTVSRSQDGSPLRMIGTHTDITERKAAEEQIRIAAATFNSHEAIMITDAAANIIRVNQAFEKTTGYSSAEVLGKNPRILNSGRHDKAFFTKMWQTLLDQGRWDGEVWDRNKDGQVYPKDLTITAVKDFSGELSQYVAIFTDISDRKRAEEEIHALAFNDVLTGLPNRRLLIDRVGVALAASDRSQKFGALLFLDLDNFKSVNDTLGHDVGDMLLIDVAHRIKLCIREVDTVARLGGDEFVVLTENVSDDEEHASQLVAQIAEKIRSVLATPHRLKDTLQFCPPSIGVCLFQGNRETIDELFKRADMAMYQAKNTGRNRVQFFDPKMQHSVEARTALESDLRQAITEQQLHLHYQIQLDHNHQPMGAEALIRWIHPKRGLVSPAQFIPIAEESSLILDIGHWVLDTACKQIAAWMDNERTRDLVLAVNISAPQFKQPDFVAQVKTVIEKYCIDPSRLKLELTESVAVDDMETVIRKMHALKNVLGVTLSLDDFGTGYSSLSYLKRLPLDQIKIDQSFVRNMTTDASDAVMVKTIIEMAKNFGLNVIAEGVETEAQSELLKDSGCEAYQGYLFSKPVPIEQFEALLKGT